MQLRLNPGLIHFRQCRVTCLRQCRVTCLTLCHLPKPPELCMTNNLNLMGGIKPLPTLLFFIFLSVCLSGFVRPSLFSTSWVQDYVVHHRPTVSTTGLCCAPWCTRGPMYFCTDIHFGSAQRGFVPIRWCTRQFCARPT